MKALTIYQPWASLIMAGAKPYEFRKWSPRERGGAYGKLIGQRVVIHASSRRIRSREMAYILDRIGEGGDAAAGLCLHLDKATPVLDAAYAMSLCDDDGSGTWLRYGVGLGTAILGEPRNGVEVAGEFGLSWANDSDRRDHANFAWPMLDVDVWGEPIPMRGFQGFWNWPTPESAGL
jgi:hypothetical protein